MLGTYHLTVLYDVLKDLHFLYQSEKIYTYLLENIVKALDADAASLFISDEARAHLTLKSCMGPKKGMLEMVAEELTFPFGKGLCGWVAQFNQPVIVEDTAKDGRFNPQVDTLIGYKTKSILCAPLSNTEEVFGVIEVLNKKSSFFNKNDMDLLAVICKQTAIALENARLMARLTAEKNFNESLLMNLGGGLISIDRKERVTHLNPSACRILGLRGEDVIGMPGADVLKDFPAVYREISETMKTREKKSRQSMDCQKPDGSAIQVGYSTFVIQEKEKLLGAGIIFQDLSALEAN